MGNNRFYSKTA